MLRKIVTTSILNTILGIIGILYISQFQYFLERITNYLQKSSKVLTVSTIISTSGEEQSQNLTVFFNITYYLVLVGVNIYFYKTAKDKKQSVLLSGAFFIVPMIIYIVLAGLF